MGTGAPRDGVGGDSAVVAFADPEAHGWRRPQRVVESGRLELPEGRERPCVDGQDAAAVGAPRPARPRQLRVRRGDREPRMLEEVQTFADLEAGVDEGERVARGAARS